MTTQVKEDFGEGAANITDEHGGQARLVDALRDGIDDETELRTQFNALLAALDAEGALGGGYVTGFTPAAQKLTKG